MNESVVRQGFREQVRRNLVALISLVVALASLSYNTWRNEKTEHNRNLRHAGFELILALGELQQIVFFSHYDRDDERGNPRAGWTRVILLDDLSEIMPSRVGATADSLRETWAANWDGLGESDESERRISESIDALRAATLETLEELD